MATKKTAADDALESNQAAMQDQQQETGDNAQQSGQSSLGSNRNHNQDPGSKIKFALFAAVVVILMLCIFVKPWQWFGSDETEKKPEEEEKQNVSLTSNQELMQGEMPVDHEEDLEPDLEKKSEEKKNDDSLGLVPESQSEPALDSSAQYSSGPAKPSLEDLKFQVRQTIERVDALEKQEQQEKPELTS